MTLSPACVLSILVVLLWAHADTASGQQAPTRVAARATSPTSINVTWQLPAGGTADEFIINYSFTINECDDGDMQQVTITGVDGSSRSYTISDDSTTPVEEDSQYTITVSTVSIDGTTSEPSTSAPVTTRGAAPGAPQSLRLQSVNVTNITVQWDRVNCTQRNGLTDSYRVTTIGPDDTLDFDIVSGTGEEDRMFSLTGLPPRTSYTFKVQAVNTVLFVFGDAATLTVNTSAPQNIGFLLGGRLYPNNSVVTLSDIGSSGPSVTLFCLTPSTDCCSSSETPNADTVIREWYLPDGSLLSTANTAFTRGQVSSAVTLNHAGSGTSPTGVFRCELPDASGTSQSVYVGIYPETAGSPTITSVLFDRNSTTLTCTSTRGPPTTVTWMKDGAPVNESVYQQSQRVVHTENATYENVLFNDNVADFVGTFTCEVSNVRRTQSVQESVELNGVSITRSGFVVGNPSIATCRSDTLATRMEWLTNGVVVESATSTQTLDLIIPLINDSIHNNVFICRVTREDGMIATQNFTVDVVVPSDSVVAAVSRSGTARAGMVYNLTCTVTKVDGLINSPTATWIASIGMMPVSNGNGITVATSNDGMSAVSTLTFDPLRTSHNSAYMCVGSLNSPALQTPLMPSVEEELSVQISTPDITVTVPDGPLYAGQEAPVVLTCSISLNPATDTGVAVSNSDISWLNGTTPLSGDDPRVTISLDDSRPPFTSTLSLLPLSTFDMTNFTCRARVRPRAGERGFVTASGDGNGSTSITVSTPAPPTIQITQSTAGPVLAGESLTLNCSATVQEGIMGSPILTWSRDNVELAAGAGSGFVLLSFSALNTTSGGNYTCTARLLIPESGVDVTGTSVITLVVQIPVPSVSITTTPVSGSFHEGVALSIMCLVELHPSVDSPVSVRGRWLHNRTQLQNSSNGNGLMFTNNFTSTPPYTINISFDPVTLADSGVYSCEANVVPQNALLIREPERLATNQLTVYVQDLPSPTITVQLRQPSACGVGNVLNCTAVMVTGLVSIPTISWIGPNGSPVPTGNTSDPSVDPLTSQLVFSDVNAANRGQYKCRAAVREDIDAFASINIRNNVPGKVRNLVCAKSSSPTELSFSWELPTMLGEEVMDYRVEVKELHHRTGTREVELFDVDGYNTEMKETTVSQGLAAEVPYSISVKALNVAGCGPEQQTYCFTQEGVPPPPENVTVALSNSTSIKICWKQFTLVELKSLAQYNIMYREAMSEREMSRVLVPWTQNCATIDNLQPGVAYVISIATSSRNQTSAPVSLQANTRAPLAQPQNNTTPIIVGVVVSVVIIVAVVVLAVIIIGVCIRRKRRSAEMKFERTRMLRAFDAPMVGKPERYSLDMDKDNQAFADNEKHDLTSSTENKTVESELVENPATLPVTFTQLPDSTAKSTTESGALPANGTDNSSEVA